MVTTLNLQMTRQEANGLFQAIDTDGSGDVDPDELDSFFALMRIHDESPSVQLPAPAPLALTDVSELKKELACLKELLQDEAKSRQKAEATQRQMAAALNAITKQQEELQALVVSMLPRVEL